MRAAIYCRVSTAAQGEDGTSLGTQEERCQQHARERGYVATATYREMYSGVELWDRPQLTTLREAIRRREVDGSSPTRLTAWPATQSISASSSRRPTTPGWWWSS